MAERIWLGAADPVAQVDTTQVTAFDVTTTYIITINGDTVSVLGDTDEDTTATNLQLALEASTNPYFVSINWTVTTDTITGTAGSPGNAHTFTSSVSGGAGTIGAVASVTASSGPNDWGVARNWSGTTVPVSTDDVIITNSAVPITQGLDQNAVVLASLTIKGDYTGRIGLVEKAFATTTDGGTTSPTKDEYKDQYLQIGATLMSIGENFTGRPQTGSTMIKIDNGTDETKATIHQTASSSFESSKPAVQLKGVNSSNAMFVRAANASVGLAVGAFEVSTYASIEVGSGMSSGGVVTGAGVTLTTFTQKSGTSFINATANITTLKCLGGTVSTEGEGYLITTVTVGSSSTFKPNHTNAGGVNITTLTYISTATVDTRDSSDVRTITTVNLVSGAIFQADKNIVIVTDFVLPSQDYELELA